MLCDLNDLQATELEALIDACTLQTVIEALADICAAKAEHVAANWQDSHLASAWDSAAARLRSVVAAPAIRRVSI